MDHCGSSANCPGFCHYYEGIEKMKAPKNPQWSQTPATPLATSAPILPRIRFRATRGKMLISRQIKTRARLGPSFQLRLPRQQVAAASRKLHRRFLRSQSHSAPTAHQDGLKMTLWFWFLETLTCLVILARARF
jgi:hypothetical protein